MLLFSHEKETRAHPHQFLYLLQHGTRGRHIRLGFCFRCAAARSAGKFVVTWFHFPRTSRARLKHFLSACRNMHFIITSTVQFTINQGCCAGPFLSSIYQNFIAWSLPSPLSPSPLPPPPPWPSSGPMWSRLCRHMCRHLYCTVWLKHLLLNMLVIVFKVLLRIWYCTLCTVQYLITCRYRCCSFN